MIRRRMVSLLVVLCLCAGIISCAGASPAALGSVKAAASVKHPVEFITLSQDTVNVPVTKGVTLKATVTPSNASVKKLEWSSADERIATVAANGKVTGKSEGTTVVTAKATDGSGVSASCEVHVVSPIKSITLSEKKLLLAPGVSERITAVTAPESATLRDVVWSSSKEKVAKVDQKGVVTGVAKGTATITATAKDGSGVKASLTVQVKEYDVVLRMNVESVAVDFDTVDSRLGSKLVVGKYVIGEYDETKVRYKNGCVRSEENGILIPVEPGEDTVTITVKHNGKNLLRREEYKILVMKAAEEESEKTGE